MTAPTVPMACPASAASVDSTPDEHLVDAVASKALPRWHEPDEDELVRSSASGAEACGAVPTGAGSRLPDLPP